MHHHNNNCDEGKIVNAAPFNIDNPFSGPCSIPKTKILLLETHLEGNLGDELETTAVLQDWRRCHVHVTVALSQWKRQSQQSQQQQLHDRTIREQALVDRILSSPPNGTTDMLDYDLVVLAPGPWRLCELRQQWPFRKLDVLLGGSFMKEEEEERPGCDLKVLLQEFWDIQLVVPREMASYQLAQRLLPEVVVPSPSSKLLFGGDFSYSFQPALAPLRYHQEQLDKTLRGATLIFSRARNFGNGLRIVRKKDRHQQQQDNDAYTILLKLANGTKVQLPMDGDAQRKRMVVLATSSDIEDAAHFATLPQEHPGILRSDDKLRLFICRSVEELWALISVASHVYTDRYHPGVVAHMLGIPFDTLQYPYEQIKLQGLEASKNQTPAMLQRRNQDALEEVRKLMVRPRRDEG